MKPSIKSLVPILLFMALGRVHAVGVTAIETPGIADGTTAIVLENQLLRITVEPERGGRITHFIDKRSGNNHVYMGRNNPDIGGVLDDHSGHSEENYEATLKQTPDEVTLTLTLKGKDLTISKRLRLRAASPILTAEYEISNRSQKTVGRLQNRNYIVPGVSPASQQHVYYMPIQKMGLHISPYKLRVPRHIHDGYMIPPGANWSAFINTTLRSGMAISFRQPFIRGWYSWPDSDIFPTWEWFAQPLEAGHRYRYTVDLIAVDGFAGLVNASHNLLLDATPAIEGQNLVIPWRYQPLDTAAGAETTLSATLRGTDGEDIETRTVPVSLEDGESSATGTITLPLTGTGNRVVVLHLAGVDGPSQPITLPVQREAKSPAITWDPVFEEPVFSEKIADWEAQNVVWQASPTPQEKQRGFVVFEEATNRIITRTTASLPIDLGRGEYESVSLQIFPVIAVGHIAISSTAPGRLPIEITVQEDEEGEQHYSKSRITRRKLVSTNEFIPRPDEARRIWFKAHAPRDLPPGDYTETVTIAADQLPPAKIDLKIKVWPVRLPEARYFQAEAEHLSNRLPGTKYENGVVHHGQSKLYLDDLVRHNINWAQLDGIWRLGNAGLRPEFHELKLRDSGQSLLEALKQNPEQFRDGPLPDLDFSYWNPIFDLTIAAGMTRLNWTCSYVPGHFSNFLPLSKIIYGGNPEPTSPEHQRVRNWFYREAGRYFDDLGYRARYAKIDDETPSDKIPLWNQAAAEYQAAGFKTVLSTSNRLIRDREAVRLIDTYLDHWWIGGVDRDDLRKRLEAGDISNEDTLWSYVGSGTIWQSYGAMRSASGLINPVNGLTGFHNHEYWRWTQDNCIIFPSPQGPISSPAWEGVRDGLDDARYYRYAEALISALPADKSKAYAERLRNVADVSDSAIVKLKTVRGESGRRIVLVDQEDLASFRKAKRELLSIIAELEPQVELPPHLRLGDLDLAKRVFVIGSETNQDAVEALRETIKKRCGVTITTLHENDLSAERRSSGDFVVLGGPTESPWVADLNQLADDKPFTARYPADGWYVIREFSENNGRNILVVGGRDKAGTLRGIAALANLLE